MFPLTVLTGRMMETLGPLATFSKSYVRNLGITFDSALTLHDHVRLVILAFIRNIISHAFASSFTFLNKTSLEHLQDIHNDPARFLKVFYSPVTLLLI